MLLWDRIEQRAVSINGVYCPFGMIGSVLKRFARPALFFNANSSIEVSFSGSATMLRYRGRRFVVFTRHQLGMPEQSLGHHDVSNFVLITEPIPKRLLALTPSQAIHPVPSAGFESLGDLTIVEYEAQQFSVGGEPDFFNLDAEGPSEQEGVSIAIGYPHYAAEFDISDEGS